MIEGAGIGLRHPHLQPVLDEQPKIGWFEVHSENFFYDSLAADQLQQITQSYSISLHGVGLSLGSADSLNQQHLQQLRASIDRFQPDLVSEHLAWSSINGDYLHDLLPMPYTKESLHHFSDKVKQAQDFLGCQILIENPSSYVQFKASEIPEWDFFAALPGLSGCGLLLDVNNIYVSCMNHHYSIERYLESIDAADVGEIHLAGHTQKVLDKGTILIDDHSKPVADGVWQLYQKTLNK